MSSLLTTPIAHAGRPTSPLYTEISAESTSRGTSARCPGTNCRVPRASVVYPQPSNPPFHIFGSLYIPLHFAPPIRGSRSGQHTLSMASLLRTRVTFFFSLSLSPLIVSGIATVKVTLSLTAATQDFPLFGAPLIPMTPTKKSKSERGEGLRHLSGSVQPCRF